MSSLAGLGKAGLWAVDIDNEDVIDHVSNWSITIRSPFCYVQSALPNLDLLRELSEFLKRGQSANELFRLGDADNFELLVGISDSQLLFRMGRVRSLVTKGFPWLLECVVDAQEAGNLAKALEEALMEAEGP